MTHIHLVCGHCVVDSVGFLARYVHTETHDGLLGGDMGTWDKFRPWMFGFLVKEQDSLDCAYCEHWRGYTLPGYPLLRSFGFLIDDDDNLPLGLASAL